MKTIETRRIDVSDGESPKKFKTIKIGFNPCSALMHLQTTPTDEEMYRRLSSKPGKMKF